MRELKIKPRAVEVKLSNGEVLIVHEPRMQDLGVFLRAMPSLIAIGRAMSAENNGVIGVPAEIPDALIEGIHPLFAIMCDISVDDFKSLPVYDGMGVLTALGQFAPNEPPSASTA